MGALAGKLLVERDPPAQHAVENVGGHSAGGETWDFRLGGDTRARHRQIIAVNCVGVADPGSEKPNCPRPLRGVVAPLSGRAGCGTQPKIELARIIAFPL